MRENFSLEKGLIVFVCDEEGVSSQHVSSGLCLCLCLLNSFQSLAGKVQFGDSIKDFHLLSFMVLS